MIDFEKELIETREEILHYVLESPSNLVLASIEEINKKNVFIYLSIIEDEWWISKLPTDKKDLKNETILTTLPNLENRNKIGTLKVLRYIDFCIKHVIATKYLDIGMRYETMIWILSQEKPNSLIPKTNWFGEWLRPEGDKFSTPLNFDFSKKMLTLYKAGNFEQMRFEWAKYKELEKNKSVTSVNKLDDADRMNEERKFNILADNIRQSEIEIVKERTPDFIESYVLNIPKKEIGLKKVYFEIEGQDEFSEIKLSEAIFRDVITKFEKQGRDECVWNSFIKDYNPTSKVIKFKDNSDQQVVEAEIIIEELTSPFSAVLYELNCHEAESLHIGDCRCDDHKTYNSRILTIDELKTYYDRIGT